MNTFNIPNIDFAYAEVEIIYTSAQENETLLLEDTTYDKHINFDTMVRTEDQLLTEAPELNYEDELEFPVVDIGLGSTFGEWVFSEDPLGNSINIVKTVKLSGKGYNIKTVFVDFTKSKWTLETLGIAYKLGRTRS